MRLLTMGSEDCSWVFDSLVGFLQGPIWNAPILTFIEQKSSVFEPGHSEHEDEYKKIYEEYKDLVDSMLGSYMEDIGITPEQFENACSKNSAGGLQIRFQQTLFEQVWAANDYEIFKRMMIQKNVELQLQALEMIQQRYGITPQSFLPTDGDENLQTEEESRIMEEVIKQSLEEYEINKQMLDRSTLEIEQSLVSSPEERHRLEAECKREKGLLQTALQLTIEPQLQKEESVPTKYEDEMQIKKQVDAEDLMRRQEYLNAQRDKLLALKKQEREKQLQAVETGSSKQRPRSAKAAQLALAGQPEINAQTLQVRKALAERLKSEVVGRKF
ncbi:cilia- and flagella-associated protein 36 [Zootermopsis nevadensis]|uniref:Cilia- and flagella-associated protein 36 n=1 Tax=Zootermopsis nevadensis TaxID=136037 RepID=A0A067QHK2_ZOONE|nr:cilia- and flagella-associated protein 36 [Zootermopsis nevadensis]XP_021941644.1 cilia- and flagella-associated protein 36 [Zootermopsis nevadensis]KDR03829.1 Coiled-coil domain-containing protein 104 [Zootermopsis nevadensis]